MDPDLELVAQVVRLAAALGAAEVRLQTAERRRRIAKPGATRGPQGALVRAQRARARAERMLEKPRVKLMRRILEARGAERAVAGK